MSVGTARSRSHLLSRKFRRSPGSWCRPARDQQRKLPALAASHSAIVNQARRALDRHRPGRPPGSTRASAGTRPRSVAWSDWARSAGSVWRHQTACRATRLVTTAPTRPKAKAPGFDRVAYSWREKHYPIAACAQLLNGDHECVAEPPWQSRAPTRSEQLRSLHVDAGAADTEARRQRQRRRRAAYRDLEVATDRQPGQIKEPREVRPKPSRVGCATVPPTSTCTNPPRTGAPAQVIDDPPQPKARRSTLPAGTGELP